MKEYDVIVIGAGEGAGIAFKAAEKGLRTALIDKDTWAEPASTSDAFHQRPCYSLLTGFFKVTQC